MQPGALLEANRTTGNSARAEYPGSVLARFLELRGRRIVKACGALWYALSIRNLGSSVIVLSATELAMAASQLI